MRPSVSVVVLSKNEPLIEQTLDCLSRQDFSRTYEVIVIDASDHSLEFLKLSHGKVRWMDYAAPFWRTSTIPQQRNLGISIADGEVIAFCDAGCLPRPNWLETLTGPIFSSQSALTCGPVIATAAGVYRGFNNFESLTVREAATCNLALRKDLWSDIGGFDENLFYGSDIDFTWRSWDLGHPCLVVKSAEMEMEFGDLGLSIRRAWRYGRAWARLFVKRPNRRLVMAKDSPERIFYPLILGVLFLSITISWSSVGKIGILLATLSVVALIVKNFREEAPGLIVLAHLVDGCGVIAELMVSLVGEVPPVLVISEHHKQVEELLSGNNIPYSSGRTFRTFGIHLFSAFSRARGRRIIITDAPCTVQRRLRLVRRIQALPLHSLVSRLEGSENGA
jgi:hypothetical protein